jgi:glutathione-specific gamma-glutamylcyclotransferase
VDSSERHFRDRFQIGSRGTWVFAYGSLIFRPGFAAEVALPVTLPGHGRRFWQGSPDHRGTPLAPGRVVTLVADAREQCRGLAYRLPEREATEILLGLDQRERAGFERVEVELQAEAEVLRAITYVARTDNPHFLGPAPLAVLVAEIATRHGPSGSNADYVRALAEALRGLGVTHDHVFEVEQGLAALAAQGPPESTT